MNNSRDILLKLVRMAMGWETDYSFPDEIDWSEVIRLSAEHGITAIVLDGFEVYLAHNPGVVSFLTFPINCSLKAKVLSGFNMVERNHLKHVSALLKLSNIMRSKEIPFMIMKGFACARYYPNPKHRYSGDIDIYPGMFYDKSNQALKDAGVEVDKYYYRHSVSRINNIMIENHKVLGDLRGPRRQTMEFEDWLVREANKSIQKGDITRVMDLDIPGAVFPSADFNVLFLPWHVFAHFAFERITIRQLLDWALFLVHDGQNINITQFREAKKRFTYGYSTNVNILTNLSIRYLKIPINNIPKEIVSDAVNFGDYLCDMVYDYMFVGQPRERDKNVWKFRINNIKRVWQERWKYKKVYNLPFWKFLYYKLIGVVFRIGE